MKTKRGKPAIALGVIFCVATLVIFLARRSGDAPNDQPSGKGNSAFNLEERPVTPEELEKVYTERYQSNDEGVYNANNRLNDISEKKLRERFALIAGFELPKSAVVAFANFNDRFLETTFRIEFTIPTGEVDAFFQNLENHSGYSRDRFKPILYPTLDKGVGLDFTLNSVAGAGGIDGRAYVVVDPTSGNIKFSWGLSSNE